MQNAIDADSLLVHSDLLKVGFDKSLSVDGSLDALESMFFGLDQDSRVFFPTFNYDYCGSGLYNVKKSHSQVGGFSKFIGQKYARNRTLTPVFNFVTLSSLNEFEHLKEPLTNPFGENSVFDHLKHHKGKLLFFGAPLHTNTFIHYVEEMAGIPYRYSKPFNGSITKYSGDQVKHKLHYRVRFRAEGSSVYDWSKINSDLESNGLVLKYKTGLTDSVLIDAPMLFEFWASRLDSDIHYFLTEKSKEVMNELYNKYGNPLTFENTERFSDD